MTTSIQAIVTDMDGTLLNSQHQLSPRNEQALRRAMEQGITVILATGKSRYSGASIIQTLNLDTPGVYLQGLAIYNADGSIRHERTLDPAVVRQVIEQTEGGGYTLAFYSRDTIYMGRCRKHWQQKLVSYHEPEGVPIEDLDTFVDQTPVNKAVIFCDEEVINDVRAQLAAAVGDQATLVQAVAEMLEVMPPGTSKGDGVQRLLDELGIDPAHVLALGDGENDIELLRMAGMSAAMGNAADAAKAAADVVVGTNDEDGVAQAVERFALGES